MKSTDENIVLILNKTIESITEEPMSIQKIISAVGEKIAERGLAYFKQHKVSELEKVRSVWLAKVDGTYPYYVELVLNKQGGLSRANCTCPYEFRCKHIAAVWFAVLEQTEDIPSQIPQQYFSPSEDDLYIKDLRDICNRYAKGCDYWQARRFANELAPFLEELDMLSHNLRFKLLKTFYGRLTTIIQRSDDSDGELGDLMNEAAHQLNQLYLHSTEPKLRKQIEQTWKKWIDSEEDFWLAEHCGIVEHWQTALNHSNRSQEVLEWIAEFEKTAEEYQQSSIAIWRYQALKQLEPQQAEQFLQAHLRIPEVRDLAVNLLLEKGNYLQAEKILIDGLSSKQSMKYDKQWQEALLLIAEKTVQKDKIIQYAEILLLKNSNLIHLPYYQSLKSACSPVEWQQKATMIESYLSRNDFEEKLIHFFILEKAFNKLKTSLLSSKKLSLLTKYTAKLPKDEREEVVFHWVGLLENEMKALNTRLKYAGWVKEANRILKKYPYTYNTFVKMVERFKSIYKTRTALMDELAWLNI